MSGAQEISALCTELPSPHHPKRTHSGKTILSGPVHFTIWVLVAFPLYFLHLCPSRL